MTLQLNNMDNMQHETLKSFLLMILMSGDFSSFHPLSAASWQWNTFLTVIECWVTLNKIIQRSNSF